MGVPTTIDAYNRHAIIENIYGVPYNLFAKTTVENVSNLLETVPMDTDNTTRNCLLYLTSTGHAQNAHAGYGKFTNQTCDIRIEDCTVEDICDAWIEDHPYLKKRFSAYHVKNHNQLRIDDIIDLFTVRYPSGEKITELTTQRNGKRVPLCGNNYFLREEATFHPDYFEFVIKGFILGGLMDTSSWRIRTSKYFDKGVPPMGTGECIALDLQNLYEAQLRCDEEINPFTVHFLANNVLSRRDEERMLSKKIIRRDDLVQADRRFISAFNRTVMGPGGCDDAAILTTGLLYKNLTKGDVDAAKCVAFGVYLADHIDTTDVFVPFIRAKGQDEYHAERIRKQYRHLVSDMHIIRTIYGAAKNTFPNADPRLPHHWSSSSQRYFLAQDRNGNSWISRIFDRLIHNKVSNSLDQPFFSRVDAKLEDVEKRFKNVGI